MPHDSRVIKGGSPYSASNETPRPRIAIHWILPGGADPLLTGWLLRIFVSTDSKTFLLRGQWAV